MASQFSTVAWAKHSNIYEVNIRQYTQEGTFSAFAKHLPRLKEMGVDILWLMPVTPISIQERQGSLGSYYACSSYTAINPEFGDADDFKNLIKHVHELGMKLIIDWVANHTGYDHEWVQHKEWYVLDEQGNFTEENGWKDVVDLNYNNTKMRLAMINAMQFWIKEFDVDGFRCDMAHLVPLDFWKEARTACDQLKHLFWLAECEVVAYHDVFDATYAWWWMHITEKLVQGNTGINEVYNVLHAYSQYPKDSFKLFFTSNHDENSWNGIDYEKYGNAAKPFAVFTFTWNGIPLIYSGQENGNNKRLQFFDKDCIEWDVLPPLHDFYKTLLKLHRSKVVAEGEIFNLPLKQERVMAYLRKKDNDVLLVVLNLSAEEKIKITVEHEWLQGKFKNVFSEMEYTFNGLEQFELMTGDYFVYYKNISL